MTQAILSALKASQARLELSELQFRLEFRVHAVERRGSVAPKAFGTLNIAERNCLRHGFFSQRLNSSASSAAAVSACFLLRPVP